MRVALVFTTVIAALGVQVAPQLEQSIQRIESALLPPVIIKDRALEARTLADRMRELKVPGVSVAVVRDGQVAWTRQWGVADRESGRPVTRDTRFQAASISKPVAAVAVLALVSQGRVSLDVPVNTYLTSWKIPDNEHTAATPVTLRHLLTHSAGTTVHGFRGYAAGEPVPSLVQVLDGVKPANSAPVRVDVPVGSRWRYSGGGISIAQFVVEDITKKPFAEAARELVLSPFGMTNSTYVQPLPGTLRSHAATGYRASGEPVTGKWHTYPEQAAAGLWTTAEDLAKFAIELRSIAAGTSTKVMSQAIARDMLRRQSGEWGLGVGVIGDGAALRFSHGGANEGFRAFWVGYSGSGSAVAVMTNSDAGSSLASELVRTIAAEYGWPGLAPVERTIGAGDPAAYPEFAGFYELPGRTPPFTLIIAEDGRLFRSTGAGPGQRAELLPSGPDTFFATDADFTFTFVRDSAGKVVEVRIRQGTEDLRAPKRRR